MSKARGLADLGNAFNDGALSNRNLIINGAMQVAQRGTSETGIGITGGYNTVDRWRFADAQNPPARFTQTQSTDAPDGFGFSHKFEVTTADTSVDADEMQYTDQFIEAQNLQVLKYGTSSAESFTLSFYVKCSVASTMGLRFTHEDGGGNYGASYTINATNTWERKSFTIPGNTATAINNDNGRGLRIAFGLTAGSDNAGTDSTAWGNGSIFGAHTNTFVGTSGATWQITGVQLEVGDSATPFEHRSFGDELARCQRYFEIVQPESGQQAAGIAVGYHSSTTTAIMHYFYKVRKRTEPDFTVTGQSNIRINHTGTSRNISSGAISISSNSGVDVGRMALSGASGSLGDGDGSSMAFVGDGSLQFNAEL